MQRTHHQQLLYSIASGKSAAAIGIRRLAALVANVHDSQAVQHRNRFTRTVDELFLLIRTYVPPVHIIGAAISAGILFIYVALLVLTVRLICTGTARWPNIPETGVLTVWHGSAPSVLVALRLRMPKAPVVIMVSCDPRGDCLALLCRLLGLQVVRGDGEHGGWEALIEMAERIERGACALITADGGGIAKQARAGAVALASATGKPLIALGADCRPAIFERRKWDAARIPIPFGQVAIAIGPSRLLPMPTDPNEIEAGRLWLEFALNTAASSCVEALDQIAWDET